MGPYELTRRLDIGPSDCDLARESIEWPRERVSGRALSLALWSAASIQLAEGDRARAMDLWGQVEEIAERTHVVTAMLLVPQRDATLAIIDGRLEEALALLERFVARADELGAPVRGREFNLMLLFPVAIYLGRSQDWLTAYEDAARMGMPPQTAGAIFRRAICLAQLGRMEEARSLAWPLLDQEPGRTGEDDRDLHRLTVTSPRGDYPGTSQRRRVRWLHDSPVSATWLSGTGSTCAWLAFWAKPRF